MQAGRQKEGRNEGRKEGPRGFKREGEGGKGKKTLRLKKGRHRLLSLTVASLQNAL